MAVTLATTNGYIKKKILTWTSDASGDATSSFHLDGQILGLITDPGATAPTTLYDITLPDSEAIDVLQGVGANRSATVTEDVAVVRSGTEIHPVVNDTVTFTVANAGNAKDGVATIYYIGEVK
jgi:hypothetical protein